MNSTRRRLLLGSAAMGLGLTAYSFHRGVRLPTLHWGPPPLVTSFRLDKVGQADVVDLIQTSTRADQDLRFRAFAPEPELILKMSDDINITLAVNNIADDAILTLMHDRPSVQEHVDGITRALMISAKAGDTVHCKWSLPDMEKYRFASIGDTGGDLELGWCIHRAHELGARFLLHLGDFNYQAGDYQRSIEYFDNSPIPVYVTIGNHDFHDNGAIYGTFLQEIGPKNNAFSIGKTRFVNFDTAANIVPYAAGQRGRLFDLLAADTSANDTVAFTHRPLYDPLPDSHHDIGSNGERDWIIANLKRIGARTLICGHIHIYDRQDFKGIDHIIVGQGLGHQDLIVNADHSKMAIGTVGLDGRVDYEMAPLAMPMELHCHPRIDPVKESLKDAPHSKMIDAIKQACASRIKT